MSTEDTTSVGFCAPQGYNSPLVRRLPEGKLKTAMASTSLCFWTGLFLVILVMGVSVATLGIIGVLIGGIVPILFLSMRYLWWRLVWEPFGSSSWQNEEEELGAEGQRQEVYMTFLVATGQVCCPAKCNYQRVCCCQTHTPLYLISTSIYWIIFLLCLLGLLLSSSVAHQSVNPPLFIVICYNTGGAIVLLIVSVWIVDSAVLFLTWSCAAGSYLHLLYNKNNNNNNRSTDVGESGRVQHTKVSPHDDDDVDDNTPHDEEGGGRRGLVLVNTEIEEGHGIPPCEQQHGQGEREQEHGQALVCGGGMSMEGREEEEQEEVILGGGGDDIKNVNSLAPPSVPFSSFTSFSSRQWWSKSRLLLRRVMAACSLVVFFIMISASTADSYGDPRSITLSIPIRQLPACMDGFKLVLLTDVHAGSLVGDNTVRRIVELVREWEPDAVAISGDLGDQVVNDALKQKVAPLVELKSIPDGVFWTPGNHENSAGIQGYRDLFSPTPDTDTDTEGNSSSPLKFIVTLENSYQSVSFTRGSGSGSGGGSTGTNNCSFDMAGLADESGEEGQRRGRQVAPDLNRTLWGRDPSVALVLLNHQPVHFQRYVQAGAGLILAGHTHGGQLWPNHALLWFVFGTHISGLFADSSPISNTSPSSASASASAASAVNPPAYLYVSEGTVGWGPRVRLLSYPEITYITLRNPELFAAEGSSTATDEAWRAAVIGLVLGLVTLPVSMLVCTLRAWGCCWRTEIEAEAVRGWRKTCGGVRSGREGHMHEV